MTVDARKERFELVEVLGHPMLFTCLRVDRSTVPKGLYLYEVRNDDDQCGLPVEIGRWVMVNHLSGHAYFNHMAHLNRGIGCTSCHGDVAGMERIRAPRDARMQWCLDCHRDPAPHLRPLEETASSHYSAADYLRTHSIRDGEGNRIQTPLQLGDFLKHQWKIQPRMDCTACHH